MFTCGKQVKYYENGKNKETTINKNKKKQKTQG